MVQPVTIHVVLQGRCSASVVLLMRFLDDGTAEVQADT
jgi:hypothetical protein